MFAKLKTTFIYITKHISNYFYNKIGCWKARVNISRLICLYSLEDRSTRFQLIESYRWRQEPTIPKTPKAIPIAITAIPAVRTPKVGPWAPIIIRIRPIIAAVKPPIIKIPKGPQKKPEPPPRRWLTFFGADLEALSGATGCMCSKWQ